MRALVIAHRACPLDAGENSLAGIRIAAELGADAVEIDVRSTRDGVPVLVHDRFLWRTARRPWPVRLMTYDQVRRLRLRSSGEPIATLAEAFAALPDSLTLAIDIKAPRAARATVAETLRQPGRPRAMLWSKKASALRYCRVAAPHIERALLRDARTRRGRQRFLRDATRLGVHAISVHWSVVTRQFIDTAHAAGLLVFAMSRDAESQLGKISLGLDGVVSNWPAQARAAADQIALSREPPGPRTGRPS